MNLKKRYNPVNLASQPKGLMGRNDLLSITKASLKVKKYVQTWFCG